MQITPDGAAYRRRLPHYRTPGAIYHCRFSLLPHIQAFAEDWMFEIVEAEILSHHKKTCLIYGYVVMPSHSHAVVQPLPGRFDPISWADYRQFQKLEIIIGKIKGASSRRINRILGRSGSIWKDEAFDRSARNDKDLRDMIEYVHFNPVRWGLFDSPEKYRWSSARTIYSGEEKYRGWFDLPMLPVEPKRDD